jgi:hypothetical protein
MMATAFIGKIYCLKWYNFTRNFLLIYMNDFALPTSTFYIIDSKINFSNGTAAGIISIYNLPEFLKGKKIYRNLETIETQLQIRNENRQKAGIYCVFNTVNKKFYIGSAITNRINTRFRNHCIHGSSNIYLRRAINKYGLNVFIFCI